jgi:hypothetical protein
MKNILYFLFYSFTGKMNNLSQTVIGILTITSCIHFFIYIDKHELNWSLNSMTKIILGGPIVWACFLGVVFLCIVIGLPLCLFMLLFNLSDLIFKSKENNT